jgi:hypothetical protein
MSDFLAGITAPIPGDNPFGADVNHDPDYERLKGEMGKLGDIDVGLVESLSFKILTERSKDARAMAFLAYAVLRKGEFGRLVDVFRMLADYCEENFEQIFPLREKAKTAALRWLSEPRFTSRCQVIETAGTECVLPLKDALAKLKTALEKRFQPGEAPFPLLLYKRVIEREKALADKPGPPPDGAINITPEDSSPMVAKVDNLPGQLADKNSPPDKREFQKAVTAMLEGGELQELLDCVRKMETLLKKFA